MIQDPLLNFGGVTLRPYQRRALDQLDALTRQGVRRVLLVAPTGAGKSTMAGGIILTAVAAGQRALFLAHRRELIVQMYRRLLDMGLPASDVGIVMGNDPRRRPHARVQVASIDTLRQRALPVADLVFVDECHRALATSYRTIAAHYQEAIHVGLTATPYRADGRGLKDAYDIILPVATPRELITEGYLVEPRVFTVPSSALPDLSRVRVKGGDYDERALEGAVDRASLVGNIVQHWQQHARGVRTVVFAVSIAHSRHIVASFQQAGVAAEYLDGSTPTPERDAILARLERGETLVVGSVGTLCEGWDQPSVKCAILARPTKSTGLYLQQAGRILRPWQGQRAILLDHAGCALEHGLPQQERVFSLEGEPRPSEQERHEKEPRTCPTCHAVCDRTLPECFACGESLLRPVQVPDELAGELVEATSGAVVAWEAIRQQAESDGRTSGWVTVPSAASPPGAGKAPRKNFEGDRRVLDRLRASVQSGVPLTWAQLDRARGS